jgi:hypothetical protein
VTRTSRILGDRPRVWRSVSAITHRPRMLRHSSTAAQQLKALGPMARPSEDWVISGSNTREGSAGAASVTHGSAAITFLATNHLPSL